MTTMMTTISYSTSSRVSTETGDPSRVYRFGIQPSHPGQLSLAIHWESTMSTGDGYGRHYERNDEFCVTVGR